jgi:uncharacterized HAD superfamily protein
LIRFLRKKRADMKLSVDLLDNDVKSAVVNIGKNSGYVVHSFDTPWGKK